MLSEKMKEDLIHGLRKIFGDDIQMIILYGSVAKNTLGSDPIKKYKIC